MMKRLLLTFALMVLIVCPVMGQSEEFLEQSKRAKRDCYRALTDADVARQLWKERGFSDEKANAVKEYLRGQALENYRTDMEVIREQEAKRQREVDKVAPLSDAGETSAPETSAPETSAPTTTEKKVAPPTRPDDRGGDRFEIKDRVNWGGDIGKYKDVA